MKLFNFEYKFSLRILFNFLRITSISFNKVESWIENRNLINYTNQKSINDQKIPFLSKKKVIDLKIQSGLAIN